MTRNGRRSVARGRRVEKAATANLDLAWLYNRATVRYGDAEAARQLLYRMATAVAEATYFQSPEVVLVRLRAAADELWPLSADADRPTEEQLLLLLSRMYDKGVGRGGEHGLVWCSFHGWVEGAWPEWTSCAECPCRLRSCFPAPHLDPPGRRPIYCSSSCRQRAYRRRKKEGKAEQPGLPDGQRGDQDLSSQPSDP